MRVSQQIGWSQESKLIYELIKETEKLNTLLPGNQPSYKVGVSKQIGWGNEANLYYEWLNSLSKLTAHKSNCCTPTTTTTTSSTTTTPPVTCNTYVLIPNPSFTEYSGIDCNGNPISGSVSNGLVLCARSLNEPSANFIDDSCNPECMLYSIIPSDDINEYIYTDCNNTVISGSGLSTTIYVCLKPGTESGTNVTFAQIGPCKCITYRISGDGIGEGTYTYVDCNYTPLNIIIGPSETVVMCSLTVPVVSLGVNVNVLGICNP